MNTRKTTAYVAHCSDLFNTLIDFVSHTTTVAVTYLFNGIIDFVSEELDHQEQAELTDSSPSSAILLDQ